MEAKDFSALRISLASPEQIRSWSYGEVTKPETINYRRLRPEMDGLFCERIFGPTRDWQCYCGKYKNIRYRGIICDKCGVEVTRSSVRRERMGHIELAAPVAHVWYTRRVPSYLGLLLDVSRRNLDRVLYFAQYVVTQVDQDARSKAITRIEKELELKEQELTGELEDQFSELRDNRDQLAEEFDNKVKAIRDHFDGELGRLSDEVMNEAQAAQTRVESMLGQAASAEISLQATETIVVEKGEEVTNDHISRIQTQVNEYLSKLQTEIEELSKAEIAKISGDIDDANVDVASSLEEQAEEIEERIKNLRESAEKQINELGELHVLQFLSESRYRELKSRFGNVFQANMGAEAFYEILGTLNLAKLAEELWIEVRTSKSKQRSRKATKRLRVVESLRNSRSTVIDSDETNQENEPNGNRPEWMILTVLPVIPPDLRPMVQLDGGRFATSDLNDLYRRVINRNNRLKHLLDLGAPDVIVRNEKRMLQEAVDSLIDNSQRGKALSRRGRRELKSLSDMLKGKKGRFRRNLLGKRVDYSGRSVIVIGPKLKLHQCGLPKTMALELYRPFVISRLVQYNYASNVKGAKRIIERERPEVWEVLEEVIRERPVLLNRAPTLHRLGIQAFEPLLVEGKAIQIHPLVCSAFNADFDGDQMAVHVPLSEQAVKEARELMLSTRNLLKPSDGMPIVGPSKDMVLGNYYLTMDPTVEIVAQKARADDFRSEQVLYGGEHKVGIAVRSNGYYYAQFRQVPNVELFFDETEPDDNGRPKVLETAVDRTVQALLDGEVDCILANAYEMRRYMRARGLEDQLEITNLHERRVVVDMDEVEYLYRIGLVHLHTPILLGNVYDTRSPQEEPEICTVGRAIFNRILPDEMRFVQKTMDKKVLQQLVARCYQVIGAEITTEVVDAIKNYGFHYATISGTTIAVSDLTIPDERTDILQGADEVVTRAERDFRRGLMTEEERYQITIDEWNRAKESLQDRIRNTLDPYGPIAIMAISGSTKGGFGPITQLAGMRGLMADPSGRIIDLPIRSHFREGLNALEYFISTHGARKGLADTALRTADAGYLTRRLVDVAQDMIVNRWDCNTQRGLIVARDDDIAGQSMGERIVGRCSAQDLYHPKTGRLLLSRNELISGIGDEFVAGESFDELTEEEVIDEIENLPAWVPKFTVTNRWAHDVYDPESREKLAERDKSIGGDRDATAKGIANQVLSSLSRVLQFQNGHYVEKDIYDPKTGMRLVKAGKRINKRNGAEFSKRFESSRREALNVHVEYFVRKDVFDPKTGAELAKADICIKEDSANFTERVKSSLQELLNSREGHYVKHDVYDPQTGERLAEECKSIVEDGADFAERVKSSLQELFNSREGHYVKHDVYDPQTGERLAEEGKCIEEDGADFAESVKNALEKLLEAQVMHHGLREISDADTGEKTVQEDELLVDQPQPTDHIEGEVRVECFAKHDVYDPNSGTQLVKQGELIENQLEHLDQFELIVHDGYFARHDVYDPNSGTQLVKQGELIENQLQHLDQFGLEVHVGQFAKYDVFDPNSGSQLISNGDLIENQLRSLDKYEPEVYEKHYAMQSAYDPNSGNLLVKQDDLIDEQLKPLEQFALDLRIGRFAKYDAYHPETGKPLVKKEDLIARSVNESLPLRIRSLMTYELKGNTEHKTESDLYDPRTAEKLEDHLEGNWTYVYRSISNDFEEGFHSSNPEVQVKDPTLDITDKYLRDVNEIAVRSPLTCDLIHGVCALCYGRDLGTGDMVGIGSAVGIIAAQSIGEPGTQLTLRTFHSGGTAETTDITSGLPRVEELFEARRKPKGEAVMTAIGGILRLTEREDHVRIATVIDSEVQNEIHVVPEGWEICVDDGKEIAVGVTVAKNGDAEIKAALAGKVHIEDDTVYIRDERRDEQEYEIPANARLRKNIYDGMTVGLGEQLTEGPRNPHSILRVLGPDATQMYLLGEIQEVYRSQGVNIADKHFETVIRKMMCKVQITKSGDSDLLPGELIDRLKLLEINESLIAEDREPCAGTPILLGITKAALSTESYLSAASFQHTIKVLAGAAIEGQVDPLHGLKENVIIGKLIPAGTGFHAYQDREAVAPSVTLEAQGALDFDDLSDQDDFENMLSEL